MVNPYGKVKTALDSLRGSASAGILLGLGALAVALVALVIGLRK